MKRNDTYLSEGIPRPPASFDYDAGDDVGMDEDDDFSEFLIGDYDQC